MNKSRVPRSLRMVCRCAFFSMVTAPGTFLFALLFMLAMNGSPSAQVLDAARSIARHAPAGSVMVRISPPEQGARMDAPPAAVAPASTEKALDVAVWAKGIDRLLWNCCVILVLIGAGFWMLVKLPVRTAETSAHEVKC